MRVRELVRAGIVGALLCSVMAAPGQALAAGSAPPPHVIVLEKDGPVPIPVGQMGLIASMELPRGRWAVLAKVNPAMNDFSDTGIVRCRLEAGGDADQSEHTIFDLSVTQSRLVLGLQIAHVVSRPEGGTARLRCSSTIESVEARFVRITAIKAGRLTRIDLASHTQTTRGAGIPEIVFAWRDEPVPVPAGEFGRMARIHLAQGSWAVFAKLDAAQSAGHSSHLTCRLLAGGDADKFEMGIGFFPPPPDRPIALLNVAHTFRDTNGGAVELRCRRSGQPVLASFVRLTAIRAGELTEANVGTTKAADAPTIVVGRQNETVPLPETGNDYITVARLHLPRGSWLVLAKASVGREPGTGEDVVDCRLVAGDDRDEVNLYTNDREAVALHLPHRFTSDAGGAVALRCRSGNFEGNNVRLVAFTAIKAGTLSVQRS